MDEVRRDYYDMKRQQDLTRYSSIVSPPALPTEKQLQAKCSPCKTVVYPQLDTLRDRLLYLQNKMDTKTFCNKAGVSLKVYNRLLRVDCVPVPSVLKRIAKNMGCPIEWLEHNPAAEQESVEKIEKYPELDTFAQKLEWLRGEEPVDRFCAGIQISKTSYYRYIQNKNIPTKATCQQLAKLLDVPFEWLSDKVELRNGPARYMVDPENGVDESKKKIQLTLNGNYTVQQLTAILSGFTEEYHMELTLTGM